MTSNLKQQANGRAGGSKLLSRVIGYGIIAAGVSFAASKISLPNIRLPNVNFSGMSAWAKSASASARDTVSESTSAGDRAQRQQNEIIAMATGHDVSVGRVLADIKRNGTDERSTFEYTASAGNTYLLALPPAQRFNATGLMSICYEDANATGFFNKLRIETYSLPLKQGQKAELLMPPMTVTSFMTSCKKQLGFE